MHFLDAVNYYVCKELILIPLVLFLVVQLRVTLGFGGYKFVSIEPMSVVRYRSENKFVARKICPIQLIFLFLYFLKASEL